MNNNTKPGKGKRKKERGKNKGFDFWNFLTDFRFYVALIVIIILILKECGFIFQH